MQADILVIGVTGYVGSRLVHSLLNDRYVRATYRTKTSIATKPWNDHRRLQTIYCDMFDYKSILTALEGITTVFYLVHSMSADTDDFGEADKEAAHNLVSAAKTAGVDHIIYLGGVGKTDQDLSPHLYSRLEVAQIFASSDIAHTILKAAIIIGGGSASFEIMRYLVERLPVMITPKWVRTRCQPIAITDVISYLIGCLEEPMAKNKVFEIGGPDILTYEELLQLYAQQAGLIKRLIIPVPVLTPRLSSRWVKFITPLPKALAIPLIEGLRNDATITDHRIREIIDLELLPIDEAMRQSINEREYLLLKESEGRRSDSVLNIQWSQQGDPTWSGGPYYYDRRVLLVKGSKKAIWKQIIGIGFPNGYYHANFLWKIRGLLDRLIGGPGLSRGRSDPNTVSIGDHLDFWRVTHIIPEKQLILRAEMKLPGIASLKFNIIERSGDRYIIEQVASFAPKGLLGLLYWKFVEPLHQSVFKGMLESMARHAGATILKGPVTIDKSIELE